MFEYYNWIVIAHKHMLLNIYRSLSASHKNQSVIKKWPVNENSFFTMPNISVEYQLRTTRVIPYFQTYLTIKP